jgi:hypothetical protein
MKVSTRVTTITPRMAMRWLEGNVHNRRLRQVVVNRYARDMAAGKWTLTHQGVAFDGNGTLVDGQHRLWAIVESDVPIQMTVTRGVPMEAQMVIDDHLTRTGSDALSLYTGQTVHQVIVAVIRCLSSGFNKGKMSHVELARGLERYKPALEFVQDNFRNMMRGITSAPVLTAVARAYYHVEPDTLQKFCRVLITGESQDGCSKTQNKNGVMLRNFLLLKVPTASIQRRGVGRIDRGEVCARAERAIRAFVDDEPISRLMAPKEELFPLPSDGKPRRKWKLSPASVRENRLKRAAKK